MLEGKETKPITGGELCQKHWTTCVDSVSFKCKKYPENHFPTLINYRQISYCLFFSSTEGVKDYRSKTLITDSVI